MAKEQTALFRHNLKRLMAEKKWDLHDLAEESGVSHSVLKKYSAGYREPKLAFREILAQTFGVKESEFYKPTEPEQDKNKKLSNLDTAELKKVITEVLSESPAADKEILKLAKAIPMDILNLLSLQNETYFNSLRRVLQGLESKKTATKKRKSS